MSQSSCKTLGIIGTTRVDWATDLFQRLTTLTSGEANQPLHVILDSNPRFPEVVAGAQRLAAAGAGLLLIADTAGHRFASEASDATGLDVVNMVEEAVGYVCDWHIHPQKIGVLDEDSGLATNLYQDLITKRRIEPVCLDADKQAQFTEIGGEIAVNGQSVESKNAMKRLAESLIDRGSEVIIAGCPWAAAALREFNMAAMVVDATEIAARRCVARAT